MKRIVLAAWLVIGSVAAVGQQEWVHVGQDTGHTKYSTLDQINVDNAQTLRRTRRNVTCLRSNSRGFI